MALTTDGGITLATNQFEETRRFLIRVYGWMALGLLLSATVAFVTLSTPTLLLAIVNNPVVFFGLIIAELAAVWSFGSIASRFSSSVAAAVFMLYAVMNGLTFSVVLLVYTGGSVASTFVVCAGMFAALSVYGLTTQRDLTGLGSLMFMGLVGIILASAVNLFMQSDMVSWMTGFIGVVVFTGLTAYDTQKVVRLNVLGNEGSDDDRKEALTGALILYLDFVNLFLSLLRLFGRRR